MKRGQKSMWVRSTTIAATLALSVFSGLASATIYSNSYDMDIFPFGSPDTTSYGQVFNSSGGVLTDWSFYASSGNAGDLQLVIADWNGSYAVGPALYTSSVFSYIGGSQTLQFSGINTNLPVDDYIAFITVADLGNPASNVFMAGSYDDGGLGGGFTFANTNGVDPLVLGGWNSVGDWSPSNMQFSATMVPEPETYAMLLAGLGLLGFMARRRRESAV